MRNFVNQWFCFLLIIFAVAGCNEYIEFSDKPVNDYTAIKNNTWIPDWLPPEVKQVREIHNLDTNQTLISFQLDEQARRSFIAELDQVVKKEEIVHPSDNLASRAAWWPKDSLKQNVEFGAWKIYSKSYDTHKYYIAETDTDVM